MIRRPAPDLATWWRVVEPPRAPAGPARGLAAQPLPPAAGALLDALADRLQSPDLQSREFGWIAARIAAALQRGASFEMPDPHGWYPRVPSRRPRRRSEPRPELERVRVEAAAALRRFGAPVVDHAGLRLLLRPNAQWRP